jgi:hypothetical protein
LVKWNTDRRRANRALKEKQVRLIEALNVIKEDLKGERQRLAEYRRLTELGLPAWALFRKSRWGALGNQVIQDLTETSGNLNDIRLKVLLARAYEILEQIERMAERNLNYILQTYIANAQLIGLNAQGGATLTSTMLLQLNTPPTREMLLQLMDSALEGIVDTLEQMDLYLRNASLSDKNFGKLLLKHGYRLSGHVQ